MTSRRWTVIAVALILSGVIPDAHAADARVVRAVVLRSGDRVSLAIEMTAEPQKAVLRMLSASVLEVEAGPVAAPVRDMELGPSDAVPMLEHVSIREYRVRNRPSFVRARLTLQQPGHGNIRIVGRVVYVDLSSSAPLPPDTPVATF